MDAYSPFADDWVGRTWMILPPKSWSYVDTKTSAYLREGLILMRKTYFIIETIVLWCAYSKSSHEVTCERAIIDVKLVSTTHRWFIKWFSRNKIQVIRNFFDVFWVDKVINYFSYIWREKAVIHDYLMASFFRHIGIFNRLCEHDDAHCG